MKLIILKILLNNMSETKDGLFYDLYDFFKSVYLFSHMKTNLVDQYVQKMETSAVALLLLISSSIFFFVLFKTSIVLGYFLCTQALTAFIRFIKIVYKSKFKINFKSSCKNSMLFFGKLCKKIYTFNFYIFDTKYINFFMLLSFWDCLISNFVFNIINYLNLEVPEKSSNFLIFFYMSFEFNLLIEIICCTFYAHREMNTSSLLALGYYFVINVIMVIIFYIARRKEYLYGAFLFEEPQRILNIIVFFILFVLKVNCLIEIIKFNKRSKYIIILYLSFFIHRTIF